MGRYYYSSKQEADRLLNIDVFWLRKYEYFIGYKSGGIQWTHHRSDKTTSISIVSTVNEDEKKIQLSYIQTSDTGRREFEYDVQLVTTLCNYGGSRYWFICPLVVNGKPCNRRVGTLYKGGDYFGCRSCYNLTYSDRNNNRFGRYAPLGRIWDLEARMEKLHPTIKRKYYNGRATRKYKKFLKLSNNIDALSGVLPKMFLI